MQRPNLTDYELTYNSFQARGVQESSNRYDARGEMLYGPIPNAAKTIAEIEIVFSFSRQLPTAGDLALLSHAGFISTGTGRNRGREFIGPRQRYGGVTCSND